MAARTQYHVVHHGSEWCVTSNNYILSRHTSKEDAVRQGRLVARANAPSELYIHGLDGKIQERETYGDDPYPPVG